MPAFNNGPVQQLLSDKRYVVTSATRKPVFFDDARCANGHAYLNRGTVWLTKDIEFADRNWVAHRNGTQPLICYVYR